MQAAASQCRIERDSALAGRPSESAECGCLRLRGLPVALSRQVLDLEAQRYELELDMLMLCKHRNIAIREVPIETIYIGANESSHFSPFWDSMRIYFVLLRFIGSGIISAVFDNLLFIVWFSATHAILPSQALARGAALFLNYFLLRRFVFMSNQSHTVTFGKYLATAVLFGSISYAVLSTIHSRLGIPVVVAKMLTEAGIFVVNFLVQRDFVFRRVIV